MAVYVVGILQGRSGDGEESENVSLVSEQVPKESLVDRRKAECACSASDAECNSALGRREEGEKEYPKATADHTLVHCYTLDH